MKIFVRTIRMRQLIVDGRLIVLPLALALTHGLVASSLLVECLPADGRSLVELIGQDPCHHPFGALESDGGEHHADTLKGENDPTDPCVDLSLESVGISAGVMETPSFAASAMNRLADASPHVGAMSPAMRTKTIFRWAREPVNPANGGFLQLLSLRI